MRKRSTYNSQFKRGTFPDQHWDESVRVTTHEPDPPSKSRKRNGVTAGSQTEARPGMMGKNDFGRRRKK